MSRSAKGFCQGRWEKNFLDSQALHTMPKRRAVDLVASAEEIGWGGFVREGVDDLLGGPGGGGVLGDVEVDDTSAIVREDDEEEEHPQAHGGHGDEGMPPPGPDLGERGPEETSGSVQGRSRRGALVDGGLLAEGQVFEGELAMAAEEKGEQPQHVKQEGDPERPTLWGRTVVFPAALVSGHDCHLPRTYPKPWSTIERYEDSGASGDGSKRAGRNDAA